MSELGTRAYLFRIDFKDFFLFQIAKSTRNDYQTRKITKIYRNLYLSLVVFLFLIKNFDQFFS